MPSQEIPAPPVPGAALVLDAAAIERTLRRIAHEIIEGNPDLDHLALVGIPSRGTALARRIAAAIAEIAGRPVETGVIDVSMHRDDLSIRQRMSLVEQSRLPKDLEERTLVLVDDVLYSGRTCRAAMDAISSFGRPPRIQYAVLIDRGHRELPIRADYVGKNFPTALGERVFVRLQATDRQPDAVWISRAKETAEKGEKES
ncbi:MAG: bifunctional pyr operon transcriptional regulator/uracil phosphoribosyltransferase PyrR [Chthoniobacteraceae bacterium]|nr:bifunctional pyr operon transcriptional regulator/uracil phosphoribosyltransferase PyrR [Chthoniobacteraceae bacterium]